MKRNLSALFSGWKLPDGRVLSGNYQIELRRGKDFRYTPTLVPTMCTFSERGKTVSFAESKIEDAKAFVRKHFETQVTEWK